MALIIFVRVVIGEEASRDSVPPIALPGLELTVQNRLAHTDSSQEASCCSVARMLLKALPRRSLCAPQSNHQLSIPVGSRLGVPGSWPLIQGLK